MLKTDCLSQVQQNYALSIRKKLKWNGDLTEQEIEKGGIVIDTLIAQNINFEDIELLSKISQKETIDPSIIFNRLRLIDVDTWKKVIALGEQTGKLNFNEISTIQSVIQKIKKQENIDLKRLQIVNDALDKVKKFGLDV